MKARHFASLALVAVASFALTACSGGSSDPGAVVQSLAAEAKAAGSDENAALLEDGKVSEDELYDAARRYQSCVRDLGVELPEPVMSPVDSVTLMWDELATVELGGEAAEQATQCRQQYEPVSGAFVVTHKSVMDPALVDAVSDCMVSAGFEVPPDASSVADFVGGEGEDDSGRVSQAEKCTVYNAMRLFPEQPGVTFRY